MTRNDAVVSELTSLGVDKLTSNLQALYAVIRDQCE